MEPTRTNIVEDVESSYYLKYKDELDLSTGIINMFGYVRVSTQIQAEFGSSIDTQIQLLVDECERYQYDENNRRIKYNLVRIYVDDGISGKTMTDRPSLMALQSHIDTLISGRTFKKLGLILPDLSRLTRSSSDFEHFVGWLTDNSIKLKFIDSSIDAKSEAGMLMMKMMASFYEFERKNSAFKTKLTLRSMSESGTLTGHSSYGWTTGVDENGRKLNIPVPEEQEGLLKVIELSRENPEMSAAQIKHLMNDTGIQCLRGPGRNYRGAKQTEKSIARNSKTEWTGKWTTQIIEKIIEHDRFDERKEKASDTSNVLKKDEIVMEAISEYIKENEITEYNYSQIARHIDSLYLFPKPLNRNYVKRMMLAAKIINEKATVTDVQQNPDEIVEHIKGIIATTRGVFTYKKLTDILIEQNVPLIGKRKAWNQTNVRDLCIKYNIQL